MCNCFGDKFDCPHCYHPTYSDEISLLNHCKLQDFLSRRFIYWRVCDVKRAGVVGVQMIRFCQLHIWAAQARCKAEMSPLEMNLDLVMLLSVLSPRGYMCMYSLETEHCPWACNAFLCQNVFFFLSVMRLRLSRVCVRRETWHVTRGRRNKLA